MRLWRLERVQWTKRTLASGMNESMEEPGKRSLSIPPSGLDAGTEEVSESE